MTYHGTAVVFIPTPFSIARIPPSTFLPIAHRLRLLLLQCAIHSPSSGQMPIATRRLAVALQLPLQLVYCRVYGDR